MARLLILDNYDSFTYNLVHLFKELGVTDFEVRRNDKISLPEVAKFEAVVLSPGPGLPQAAGIMAELVKTYASSKPILGVCLGHQCIGEVFGGKLRNLGRPVHGRATEIQVLQDEPALFKGIPKTFKVGRYHSWVVEASGLPSDLVVTAIDGDRNIMALRHVRYQVQGVQFHPESVLTEFGKEMISNWLRQR